MTNSISATSGAGSSAKEELGSFRRRENDATRDASHHLDEILGEKISKLAKSFSKSFSRSQAHIYTYTCTILYIYIRYIYICISLCPRTQCAPAPVSARPLSYPFPPPSPCLPPLVKIDPPPAWTGSSPRRTACSDLHPLFDKREQGAARAARAASSDTPTHPAIDPQSTPLCDRNRGDEGRKGDERRKG